MKPSPEKEKQANEKGPTPKFSFSSLAQHSKPPPGLVMQKIVLSSSPFHKNEKEWQKFSPIQSRDLNPLQGIDLTLKKPRDRSNPKETPPNKHKSFSLENIFEVPRHFTKEDLHTSKMVEEEVGVRTRRREIGGF